VSSREEAPETIELEVPGLERDAEIVVDRWGIPHIRAATRRDVFFVQGFNAARDRLWQLDLWRKRGLGRMAADFGPGFLAQDRAARLFLYRGDMVAEWGAYGTPEAESIAHAFTAGINAFIDLAGRQPAFLPPEFSAMKVRPEHWQAGDVVRIRSHALVRNVLSEAARAQVAGRAGLDADLARAALSAPGGTRVPEGLHPAEVPIDLMDVFMLATAAVTFSPERLAATLETASYWSKVNDLGEVMRVLDSQGSNNWAVAPGRTSTGRPILASDPHRAHALPSLRYIVHLTGPGIDVIGAGEPAIPGVTFGHNAHAAFAMTFFPADQSDIFVYETDPADPTRYSYGEGWETMTTVTEAIAVKGAPDQQVLLRFTRHGPVIHEDAAHHRAYAVRSVWFEPGASAYFASLAFMEKSGVSAFEEALRHWSVPPANYVYADTAGDIAWIAAGRIPRRPNWDGLMPVPGDGRFEWDGFHPPEDLPRSINPANGFVATANEMNLPPDYPNTERKISFEWAENSRATRITEVLGVQTGLSPGHSLTQSMALQTDDFSIPARRLAPLIATLSAPDDATKGDAARALDLLRGWDHRLGRHSAPAALSEVWWTRHLKPALLDGVTDDPVARKLLSPGDNETLLGMLERSSDPALLIETLAAAFATCRELLGDDPAQWQWGELHHGYFPHPLSPVAKGAWRDVGPLAKGGSGSSPMATTYRATDFRVTAGASFRMVADVGNWDESRVVNAPGQSGNPASPHYDDLAPLWAKGDYVPLLYSREAVDGAARLHIRLRIGKPTRS
jgi:penicillin G amidase